MRYITLFCCLLWPLLSAAYELRSPNGELTLQFELTAQGAPRYALQYKGKPVIKESQLGLTLQRIPAMMTGFKVVEVQQQQVDTLWTPVWGEQRQIRDNHRELFVVLSQPAVQDRRIGIRFRLFDDGLGFRYEFPQQESLSHFVVEQEQTQFNLAGDHTAYWIPGDYDTNEYLYTTCKISQMRALQKQATIFIQDQSPIEHLSTQTPLMLKSDDGLYINIHEAALIDYPAMCLNVCDSIFSLSTHIVPDAAGSRGYMQTDCHTPWRTVVVSDRATDILASRLILNLNEPCAYAQTDWIKPIKYVGIWWEYFLGLSKWSYTASRNVKLDTDYRTLEPHGKHGATTENVKRYIDFAADNGFAAVLVEGWNIGWERYSFLWKDENFDYVTPYPDFDVEALHAYAAARGVRVMMHHETASSVGNYERRMKDAFQFMVDNGYNSVKTGYVGAITPRGEHHDSQWMVNHYARVARLAADYKIMVNSHEAVRPTGLCRTYPNWLAQESARGTEFESISLEGNPPEHTCILPFTRLMGGPMDYTPGILETDIASFGEKPNRRVHSTLVKQLALYLTMYSPLQMAADTPDNYHRYADAFQFIRDVAVDWDDSWYLEAEPGDYITVARKAKQQAEWFVGGITDEHARIATIPFHYLDAGKRYVATIYADGKDADYNTNPKSYTIRQVLVDSKTILRQQLAAGGGVAISIRQATPDQCRRLKRL